MLCILLTCMPFANSYLHAFLSSILPLENIHFVLLQCSLSFKLQFTRHMSITLSWVNWKCLFFFWKTILSIHILLLNSALSFKKNQLQKFQVRENPDSYQYLCVKIVMHLSKSNASVGYFLGQLHRIVGPRPRKIMVSLGPRFYDYFWSIITKCHNDVFKHSYKRDQKIIIIWNSEENENI